MRARITAECHLLLEAWTPEEQADLDALAKRARGAGLVVLNSGGNYGPEGCVKTSILLGTEGPPPAGEADVGVQDQSRTRLLARMAGNIAAGLAPILLQSFSDEGDETDLIAEAAIEIAQQILAKLENKE